MAKKILSQFIKFERNYLASDFAGDINIDDKVKLRLQTES